MKKLLPVLAVLAIIGLGGYFLLAKKGGGVSLSKTYTMKSLKAIIDLGVPVKCSYKVGQVEYEGYVKGQQWRGKMQSADNKQAEVIIKDNCMWTWATADVQGMKMCFEPTEEGGTIWDDPQTMAADLEYTCRPAAITDDKFNPPADITFLTFEEMMMQGVPNMPGANDETPAMPENMPDMPDMTGVPDSPEDFDMSRYQDQ